MSTRRWRSTDASAHGEEGLQDVQVYISMAITAICSELKLRCKRARSLSPLRSLFIFIVPAGQGMQSD